MSILDWTFDVGTGEWLLLSRDGWVRPTGEGRWKAVYDGRVLGEVDDPHDGLRLVNRAVEQEMLDKLGTDVTEEQ
jgi:hypothetical protein